MKKLLSLVIVLAMVIAMVPMGASAESMNMSFTTFAELKELVTLTGYDYVDAFYEGAEPLVIEEDITLPQNFVLRSNQAMVTIAEGVTVTAYGQMMVNELTVNGTLVNHTYVDAVNSLTVNGAVTNYGTLGMYSVTAVTGEDKITHVENGRIHMNYTGISAVEQLSAALADATADSDPRTYYYIRVTGMYESTNPVALAADLVIPANATVYLTSGTFTLPAGSTLTVNGMLFLEYQAVLNVEGTLVNNARVDISYDNRSLLNMENGAYQGTGTLYIYSYAEVIDSQTAVPGLDLSQFPYVYEEDWGWWLTYENIYGDSSSIEFESFAELKELVANAGEDWVEWVYIGTEPLVITEDLTLPENKQMSCFSAPLVIAEGVTLISYTHFGTNELTVNGKFVNNGGVYVFNLLTVNGSIENRAEITLEGHSIVVNKENITHIGGWLQWQYFPENMAELTEACTIAASDPSAVYTLWVYQSIVVDSDLVIPENVKLWLDGGNITVSSGSTLTVNGNTWLFSGNITVSSGSTLTTNGDLYLYGPLNVEGMLVNNSTLVVGYTNGGLLNMAGTYAGEGEIQIQSEDEKIDVETAAPGLDVSYFPYVYEEDWGWWLTHYDYNGGGGGNSVASFEELCVAMESAGSDETVVVNYTGSEPLTIEDSITFPANMMLVVPEMIVPEGVTLTVDGLIQGNIITVNGIVVNNRAVAAMQELTVNGKLINNYVIQIMNTAKLVGVDKIEYGTLEDGRPAQLHWNWEVSTEDELREAINEAVANADNPSYWYAVALYNENELVLTEDMTVPYQAELYAYDGPVTVPEGVTLTLEGRMYITAPMTVEGKLVSNKQIVVYNVYGATLQITESGSYSGKGDIWVYVENADRGLAGAVSGIDLSNATFDDNQGVFIIPPAEEEHTHEWGEGVVTTPATCTAEGVLTYTCECGETKTEAIPVTAHSFGEWVTILEPTTTTEGKAERKCACGETETKVLPILYTVPDVETSVSDSEFVEKLEDAGDKAYIVAEVTGETTLPETVFEAISGTDKLLELVSEDVTWQFLGSDIVNESKEVDLSVEIAKAEDSAQEIEEKLSENPGVVMKFAENGQLPGKATIQVKLDEDLKTYLGESDKLCVYYYNEETDELELIAENVEVIDGAYVEFAITHCSYYVLTTEIEAEEEQLPKLGDVNNDGRLSAKDATMILRWVVRKLTDVPAHFEQVADVNDDGKISAKDATMILRFVVGKGDIPGWER